MAVWRWLGRVPFAATAREQERLRADLLRGDAPETLLLCEHHPVVTLGRSADPAHVLAPRAELARRGIEVELPSRRSIVHSLDIVAYDGKSARLSLHVSSGTYVRSLAQALGGHCTTLRRTAVGPFSVDEADDDPTTARLLEVEGVLARLPHDALEKVAAPIRAGVLAAAAGGGVGAA